MWRATLAAPLWLKILGANLIIVAGAIAGARVAADGAVGPGTLVAGVSAALALCIVVNIALVVLALRPVRSLEQTAARVWHGDLSARVPASLLADRDMARVGRTINSLVDALTDDRARTRWLAAEIFRQAELDQSRIANELHESAAQRLAAQLLQITAIAQDTSDDSTRRRLAELREMSAQTLEQLRTLAEAMYPQVLDDLGLPAAIDRLARIASERHHCPVRTRLDVREPLPIDVASVLYGIVQEAINSAVEQGKTTDVLVTLTTKDGWADLSIHHDGAAPRETPSLLAVRQRVELAEGSLEIRETSGVGTRVTAAVPLISKAYDATPAASNGAARGRVPLSSVTERS